MDFRKLRTRGRRIGILLLLLLLQAAANGHGGHGEARLYLALEARPAPGFGVRLEQHHLLLLSDGRIHRGLPKAGLTPASLAASQRDLPKTWGRWRRDGSALHVTWAGGSRWVLQIDGHRLKFRSRTYEPLLPVPPTSLHGNWIAEDGASAGTPGNTQTSVGRTSRVRFLIDGRFVWRSFIGAAHSSRNPESEVDRRGRRSRAGGTATSRRQGRYRLDDYTLTLSPEGRPVERHTVYRLGGEGERLGIGKRLYRREGENARPEASGRGRKRRTGAAASHASLNAAILAGDVAAVRGYLDRGTSVEQPNRKGSTPLHVACFKGHLDVVRLLLDRGARHEALNPSGWTPLRLAVFRGHAAVTDLLLARGARVDRSFKDGWTPLLHSLERHQPDVARVLIARGAPINTCDRRGDTPLHLATARAEVTIMECLLARGALIEARNASGQTPLHRAVLADQKKSLLLLLKHGARRTARDARGRTPRDLAAATDRLRHLVALL